MQPGGFRTEICARCRQVVTPEAGRCPRCGTPILRDRVIALWVGVAGLVVLLIVVFLAVKTLPKSDSGTEGSGASQTSAQS